MSLGGRVRPILPHPIDGYKPLWSGQKLLYDPLLVEVAAGGVAVEGLPPCSRATLPK
jgi:hypothetical protein